jgi:hypothetical protein
MQYGIPKYRTGYMSDLEAVILLGLKENGREKTFSQMLDEANITSDATQRVELACALEAAGLIQAVSYQLPVAIRAELTDAGKEAAESLVGMRKLTKRELRGHGYH